MSDPLNARTKPQKESILNTDHDKFLFVFTPEKLDFDCCCGCSLRTGVKIISILFFVAGLSSFYTAVNSGSVINILTSLLVFLVYFVAASLLIYSTINFTFKYAYAAYLIYAVVFLFNLFDVVITVILIFAGIYHPFKETSRLVNGVGVLIGGTLILSFFLYMLWVIFSYAIHLKHKRIKLVFGDYGSMELAEIQI